MLTVRESTGLNGRGHSCLIGVRCGGLIGVRSKFLRFRLKPAEPGGPEWSFAKKRRDFAEQNVPEIP